jgi:hypothetical protein
LECGDLSPPFFECDLAVTQKQSGDKSPHSKFETDLGTRREKKGQTTEGLPFLQLQF